MQLKLLLVLIITTVVACANRSDVRAPNNIRESFITEESNELGISKHNIIVLKATLEKEYLFRTSVVEQIPAPMFQGHKSRIVSFRLKGDKIYMLEAAHGHVVENGVDPNIIIAEFDILETRQNGYLIDYNKGMQHLYVTGEWYASDMAGENYSDSSTALKTHSSYIEDAKFVSDDTLMIKQIAQMYSPDAPAVMGQTYEIHYFLSPYKSNPKFNSTRKFNFDDVGYFQVNPKFEADGTTVTHASKFDISKPIVFEISQNTPVEYRKAVEDGILYWNKAFGREVLKAKVAEKGVRAPQAHRNIIQWIQWDASGFAYADANADPRTGEIYNAQVFMTSYWAVGTRYGVRRMIDLLDKAEHNHTNAKLKLKGFESGVLCDHNKVESWKMRLQRMLADNYSDEQILAASQDAIRDTVAHEVGHTLGLRHNFAGSLASDVPMSEHKAVYKQYLEDTLDVDTVNFSTTVMDYLPDVESHVTGRKIERSDKALSYDEMAIRYLYLNQALPEDRPLFCTDSHVSAFVDCNRHDSGTSMAEFAKYGYQSRLDAVPLMLFNSLVMAKYPEKEYDVKEITEKNMTKVVSSIAEYVLSPRANLLSSLMAGANILSIHRAYPVVDITNIDDVREESLILTQNTISEHGGLNEVLPLVKPNVLAAWRAEYDRVVEEKSSGTAHNGVEYELSEEDKQIVMARGEKLLEVLHDVLVKSSIKQQKFTQQMADHELVVNYADQLQAMLEEYVFRTVQPDLVTRRDTSSEKSFQDMLNLDVNNLVASTLDGALRASKLNVPEFYYDFETRIFAAQLLKKRRSVAPEWGYSQRKQNAARMLEIIKGATEREDECAKKECTEEEKIKAGKKLLDFMKTLEKPEALRWIHENKMILSTLSS